MDPLTQGLLGASLPQSFVKKENIRIAGLCGILGGMAPDLDILIHSDTDPLLTLEFHRHFTHSLFFVPFGGFIIAALLYLILRRQASFIPIYLYTTLGFATHGLLDACTSYGTRLYWPLSNVRVGWNIVSVIDPLFTVPLFIFFIASFVKRSQKLMRIGLGLALCYLIFGWVQHERAQSFIKEIAQSRNHPVEAIYLNPTIGNTLLWRSIYTSGKDYYVDAVYMPLFGDATLRKGFRMTRIDSETVFPALSANSVQRQDIKRFAYFSQNYIYLHPDYPNVIADLRYGTLPYDEKSFWGIKVTPEKPEEHVHLKYLRNISKQDLDTFWHMVLGDLFYDKKL